MAKEIDQLLQELHLLVEHYTQMLAQGEIVDSSALGIKVQRLCELIASLPADEANAYQAALHQLQIECRSCVQTLEAQKEVVKGDLTKLNANNKAQETYRNLSKQLSSEHSSKSIEEE